MTRSRPQITAEQERILGRLTAVLDTIAVLTETRDRLVRELRPDGQGISQRHLSQRHLSDALGTQPDGSVRLSVKQIRTIEAQTGGGQ